MKEVMGANDKVNGPKSVTIFLNDNGAVLVKPKQAFRLTQNTFKKLLQNFKKELFNRISTD